MAGGQCVRDGCENALPKRRRKFCSDECDLAVQAARKGWTRHGGQFLCQLCGEMFERLGPGRPPKTCVNCRSQWASLKTARWQKSNPERTKAHKRQSWSAWYERNRLHHAGMTNTEYDFLVALQQGRCAICNTDDPGTENGVWNVDHDHKCCGPEVRRRCGNCNRGLLCRGCNLGIGYLKESTETMRAAIDYLQFYKEQDTECLLTLA